MLNYPKTLAEALDILQHILPEEELQRLKLMDKNDLADLHFGLEQWIRNNLGLLDENYELIQDCDAKDQDEAPVGSIFIIPDNEGGWEI